MSFSRPSSAAGWQRMCLGKKKFRTEEFADKIAKKFGQRSYFCPFCSGYHCTKTPLPEVKGENHQHDGATKLPR